MIGRRGFLGAIAGAFVAPDPDRLLWTPGKKLISIPKPIAQPVNRMIWASYRDSYGRYCTISFTTTCTIIEPGMKLVVKTNETTIEGILVDGVTIPGTTRHW